MESVAQLTLDLPHCPRPLFDGGLRHILEAANSVTVDVRETLCLRTNVAPRAATRHPCGPCAAYAIPPRRRSCYEFEFGTTKSLLVTREMLPSRELDPRCC